MSIFLILSIFSPHLFSKINKLKGQKKDKRKICMVEIFKENESNMKGRQTKMDSLEVCM